MAPNPAESAQRYFDAWNRHDAAGIVSTFHDGGTYADPTTPGPLTGQAIGAYAQVLWAAFPDLSFEVASLAQNGDGLVAAEWVMRGVNTGSFMGLPPTGVTVTLPGSDFIRVEDDKIRSVQGYFDGGAVPRALGLDVIVQPKTVGPFSFGVGNRVSAGNPATPGAFSITCLEARTSEEKTRISNSARAIATELLKQPGFISLVGVTVGDRMMTITAWETPEAVAGAMRSGEHASATGRFFSPELSRGGATGVWVPHRLNPRWSRCPSCAKMGDSAAGSCRCGEPLPPPIAYW